MQQPACSPYASMSLLMHAAAPQRCSGGTWPRDLGQRETVNPGLSGRAVLLLSCSKPCHGWLGILDSIVLRSTTPGQPQGNTPGSAPQLELLALAICPLCGRTSALSFCLTSIGIVNNTIKVGNKGSAPIEKETSSIFKLCSQQLEKGRWSHHFK